MLTKPDKTVSGAQTLRRDFIPPSDYSPEMHRLEMERLWPRVWQIACREEEIPNVGDYVNYEIGHESILIIRNAPGSIKALYNVCPHRGRRLRDDPCGRMARIFCGFHGWTFDLDGKPISIPARDDWSGCPQSSDEDLSISEVKVDTWAGFVWINMDESCEPLREFLAPLPENLDALEWENCRMRSYQTIVFPVNWKVVLEAFIEGYHTHGTHPGLHKYGEIYVKGTPDVLADPPARHGSHFSHFEHKLGPGERFADARDYVYTHIIEMYDELNGIFHEESLIAARRIMEEVPEGLTTTEVWARFFDLVKEESLKAGIDFPRKLTSAHLAAIEWQIFPNSSVLPAAEGAFWYRMRPNGDDPNSCLLDVWSLGRFAPGKAPRIEREVYDSPEAFKGKNVILEQDFGNMLAVGKGVRSRGWKGARPSPFQETNVYNFHRVLHEYLDDAPEAR